MTRVARMQAVAAAVAAAVTVSGAGVGLAQADEPINADRPGLADGSTVVGHGRLQIEVGAQREFRRVERVSERSAMLPLLLRAGVGPNWEFRLETNSYVSQRSGDGLRQEGAAPVALGAKVQITDPTDRSLPSLGLIARLSPPSGSGSFRSRRTSGDLRLAADWEFAPNWSLNPNIGVARIEDDEGRTFFARTFAATLGYNPTASLNLFVDTGLQTPETKGGRVAVVVDAGIAYLLTRAVQLDFSAGKGVRGATPPRGFLSAGISARF